MPDILLPAMRQTAEFNKTPETVLVLWLAVL
jgi:hypothetical protein